jgi:Yip1-like protein
VPNLYRRMLRAALLDAELYEEVEADRAATGQACLVVVLSAIAAGIGGIEHHGLLAILGYTLAALAGWWVWAYVAYLIGTQLLPGPKTQADPGELLRTIGFSSAPGVLRVLALVSPVAGAVFLVSTVWMLVAMVVAVRQALDYTGNARAVAVCAIGFPIYAVTLALSMLLLGPWPL